MSCCGRKNNNLYTRPSVAQCYYGQTSNSTCCSNKSNNSCCGNQSNNSSCCGNQSNYSSCCGNQSNNSSCCGNQSNYSSCCGNQSNDCCETTCHNNNGLDGISCPFHNNNDCCCEESLAKALCQLTNQRVIIHTDGCKMCVVIVSVGNCFVKTINPCTQRIVYFNINRIDNVEDVLPRCY